MTNPRRLQRLREDYATAWAPLRALFEDLTYLSPAVQQRMRDTLEAAIAESLSEAEEELHAGGSRRTTPGAGHGKRASPPHT